MNKEYKLLFERIKKKTARKCERPLIYGCHKSGLFLSCCNAFFGGAGRPQFSKTSFVYFTFFGSYISSSHDIVLMI